MKLHWVVLAIAQHFRLTRLEGKIFRQEVSTNDLSYVGKNNGFCTMKL